jgi:maltose O-acetyltransferase
MKFWSYIAYFGYCIRRRRDLSMAARLLSRYRYSGSKVKRILQMAGAEVGGECSIRSPIFLEECVDLKLGDRVFINTGLTVVGNGKVEIGSHTLIGPSVTLVTAHHHLEPEARRMDRLAIHGEVLVGENVWIGANVTLCAGIHIGSDSTIGAGSVVTRDIPPRSFAAGIPCRVVRSL